MKNLVSYITESSTGIGFAGGLFETSDKERAKEIYDAAAGFKPELCDFGGGYYGVKLHMNYIYDLNSPEYAAWKKLFKDFEQDEITGLVFSCPNVAQLKVLQKKFPRPGKCNSRHYSLVGAAVSLDEFEKLMKELITLND